MIRFLFQGDSITDANRTDDHEDNFGFGYGYPLLLAADLMKNKKGEFKFINRGISGDKIVDIYARMKEDIINLKPDMMSILVGVNDVWHELNEENGVAADKYEKIYGMLIEELLEALPELKIIILEPFVLKGTGSERYYEEFRREVEKRAVSAKRLADKFGLPFVSLQKAFDEASADGNCAYWLADGVHPTAAGHQLIKEKLMVAIENIV